MKKNLVKVFFVTFLILLFVFIILGIYPFGDKSVIVIDSNTQYVSFISYLNSILLGNNDFKYLFSSSLGSNFMSLLGYYLMSPFNLFVVFFNLENIKLFMTIAIIIKICLCACTMEYFLYKKFNNEKTFIFSISYALMSYNIVYMYHLMWLDSIILFPLVILGIDYIFKEKSVVLYIVSLALSIIFNYYIGVMVCIGSVIYFIYKLVLEYELINKTKVIVNYFVSSVLGGFLSMFILLPSILGLQGGKASFSLDSLKFSFNTSYLKVFAKTFTASFGNGETWHGGPMIGCGLLILVLTIVYFLNRKISKKEKIIDGILLLVLASSFVIKPFDLLFHGLSVPNCFDYRHAFIFVFFYILVAYKSFKNIDLDRKHVKIFIVLILSSFISIYFCKYEMFTSTFNLSIIYSFVVTLIFIFMLYKGREKYIYLFVIFDLIINTGAGVLLITSSDKQYVSSYQSYVIDTKEVIDEINDNSFYRMEKTFDRENSDSMLAINDSMTFNYNGISHFNSTSKLSTEVFLENLGYRRLISRAYYNMNGGTVLGDSLLGIKYVLSKNDYKTYDKVLTKNDISVYQNPYYLSVGYVIKNDNVTFTNNVFENQNKLVKAFSGINENIYNEVLYEVSYNNLKIESNKYSPVGIGEIIYKINILENSNLYFSKGIDDNIENYANAKMYLNGEYVDDYFTKYNSGVYDLGRFNIGDTIEIKFEFSKELVLDNMYFYYEDLDVLDKHYNALKLGQANIQKISSSHLTGNITLDNDSKILFTIPYDEGWSVYVDGKKKDVSETFNALMALNLEEGSHTFELIFEPKGLSFGIAISSVSVAITFIYCLLNKRKKINFKK